MNVMIAEWIVICEIQDVVVRTVNSFMVTMTHRVTLVILWIFKVVAVQTF